MRAETSKGTAGGVLTAMMAVALVMTGLRCEDIPPKEEVGPDASSFIHSRSGRDEGRRHTGDIDPSRLHAIGGARTNPSTGPDAIPPPSEPTRLAARAVNDFGFDLFHRVRKAPGNLFFSPLSIHVAFGMTLAGARGDTANEIRRVLRLRVRGEAVHVANQALLSQLTAGHGSTYQLHIANRLWFDQQRKLLPDFLATTRERYGASAASVDFSHARDETRARINQWVSKATQGMITAVLGPGDLSGFTRLVLTNAIYFKGKWANPFPMARTKPEPFYSPGREVTVPLMLQTMRAGYSDRRSFAALELPYKGDNLTMLILLPKQEDGLDELERTLDANLLDQIAASLSRRTVVVYLPRFVSKQRLILDKALEGLGLRKAFTLAADFSGMTGQVSLFRRLYLQRAVHQAICKVNEEGTEAAAATAIRMGLFSAQPVFRADHPFLFVIRDRRSGVILFLGRLSLPG